MSQEATGEGRVRVVGTAHVSEDSVREVEEVVAAERPDVVAVELDEGRYRQMKGGAPDDIEPGDLLRGNTVFQFIAYWMLSYVQAQLGEEFDVEPGADMLAAVETAEELGVDVALVDRDINETMRRFWARMSFLEKLRMVGGLAFGLGDSRGVAVLLGLFVGLLVGPAVGLFGEILGVGLPVLARVTGGLFVFAATAAALWVVAGSVLPTSERAAVALGVGVAAGLVGGVAFGLADPLVARVGSFAVRVLGSLTIGVGGGLLLGGLALTLATAFGGSHDDEADELEEFDMSEMTDTDAVSAMMEEFREFSPGGAQALIDERDAYIAHQLVSLRRTGRSVVAVVGAGHRAGIERYLAHPEELPPMESLVGTPSDGVGGLPWAKVVGTAISVAVVGFFGLLALSTAGNDTLLRLFGAWFLINGVFAAGLAKAAGARWPSALVGGAVAWMTSVNPFLAPGWFTGYMELQYRPVNVGDIGRLNDLLADEETPVGELVSEMFEVPLFRLIVVVAATNIGSIVASALFIGYVLPLFAVDLGGSSGIIDLMFEGARNGWDILVGLLTR